MKNFLMKLYNILKKCQRLKQIFFKKNLIFSSKNSYKNLYLIKKIVQLFDKKQGVF